MIDRNNIRKNLNILLLNLISKAIIILYFINSQVISIALIRSSLLIQCYSADYIERYFMCNTLISITLTNNFLVNYKLRTLLFTKVYSVNYI